MTEKGNNNTARAVVSGIFAFVLTLVLFAGTGLSVVRFGVLEKNGIISSMNEDYYRASYENVMSEILHYTLPTNMDVKIIDNVFEYDKVKSDIKGVVVAAFDGKEYEPDLTEEKRKLENNVYAYFEENTPEAEGDVEDICREYVKDVAKLYSDKIRMPGMELVLKARNKFARIVTIVLIVLAAAAVVLIFMILRINGRADRGFKYLAWSFYANAIMLAAVPGYIFFTGRHKRLSLTPEYFYRLIVGFVGKLLKSCLAAAVVFLVLALTVTVIALFVRSRRRDKAEEAAME